MTAPPRCRVAARARRASARPSPARERRLAAGPVRDDPERAEVVVGRRTRCPTRSRRAVPCTHRIGRLVGEIRRCPRRRSTAASCVFSTPVVPARETGPVRGSPPRRRDSCPSAVEVVQHRLDPHVLVLGRVPGGDVAGAEDVPRRRLGLVASCRASIRRSTKSGFARPAAAACVVVGQAGCRRGACRRIRTARRGLQRQAQHAGARGRTAVTTPAAHRPADEVRGRDVERLERRRARRR